MGALANAERPRKEAPRPAKAYADPEAQQPAYAYPGYQQPTAKRLAKRDAVEPPLAKTNDYDNDWPSANPEQPQKAYANPGYEQPAYKRLAKRDAAAYPAKIQKKNKIAAVSVEDLNNPEYE